MSDVDDMLQDWVATDAGIRKKCSPEVICGTESIQNGHKKDIKSRPRTIY